MSDFVFDMPPAAAGFPKRGRWLIDRWAHDLNLKDFQAGGIVGNLGYESVGLAVQQEFAPVAGRGGLGWEMATGPRRRAYEAYAQRKGLSVFSDIANFGFITEELVGPYAFVVEKLSRTTSLDSAVFVFGVEDERPGGTTPDFLPGDSGRLAYARLAMAGVVVEVAPTEQDDPSIQLQSMSRQAIKIIQDALEFHGIYHGHVDGILGPLTRAAWIAYINDPDLLDDDVHWPLVT